MWHVIELIHGMIGGKNPYGHVKMKQHWFN